jgi:radical SAM/Cys-rich protein
MDEPTGKNEVLTGEDIDLSSKEAGPKPTTSLKSRRSPLASTQKQVEALELLDLSKARAGGNFAASLSSSGWERLGPAKIEIFQINVGKLCNMTCRHCHVDSGPDRVEENMDLETIDACLSALDKTEAQTVDITGGAPELNPHFRYLIDECISRGKHVIDRCNLPVLLLPRFRDLPDWLADRGVEIVCSLPHYRKRNTDAQRGEGTYEKSIEALRRVNGAGYGKGDPNLCLTLVSNPAGAYLSGNQAAMEREWKAALQKNYGVTFDRLITINNMPISRFLEWLEESGNLQNYIELLVNSFNPATISGLMCRNTISISWDGRIFDCDFNQMLELESQHPDGNRLHVRDFDPEILSRRQVATARHCFGCTAGAGSSCGGAINT